MTSSTSMGSIDWKTMLKIMVQGWMVLNNHNCRLYYKVWDLFRKNGLCWLRRLGDSGEVWLYRSQKITRLLTTFTPSHLGVENRCKFLLLKRKACEFYHSWFLWSYWWAWRPLDLLQFWLRYTLYMSEIFKNIKPGIQESDCHQNSRVKNLWLG